MRRHHRQDVVAVSTAAITEALANMYGQAALERELTRK
jgi:hypothetical protein